MDDQKDETPDADEAPSQAGIPLANAIGARNLMIIIVTMPLAFILVVMATLTIFGSPGAEKSEGASGDAVRSTPLAETLDILDQPVVAGADGVTTPTAVAGIDPAPLVIPAGAAIGSLALDGDRLAVRIEGENGGEIIVYDLARGAAIQRIRIVEGVDTGEGGL